MTGFEAASPGMACCIALLCVTKGVVEDRNLKPDTFETSAHRIGERAAAVCDLVVRGCLVRCGLVSVGDRSDRARLGLDSRRAVDLKRRVRSRVESLAGSVRVGRRRDVSRAKRDGVVGPSTSRGGTPVRVVRWSSPLGSGRNGNDSRRRLGLGAVSIDIFGERCLRWSLVAHSTNLETEPSALGISRVSVAAALDRHPLAGASREWLVCTGVECRAGSTSRGLVETMG